MDKVKQIQYIILNLKCADEGRHVLVEPDAPQFTPGVRQAEPASQGVETPNLT